MRYRKIEETEIKEIVDSNDNLIGNDDTPQNRNDLKSRSNKITDYNVGVAHQPFDDNTLAKFGFNLLPFFEGKGYEDNNKLLDEISKMVSDNKISFLKKYYKSPNKLKNDYRVLSKNDFKVNDDDNNLAKEILNIVQDHFKKYVDKRSIDEDVMLDDKKIVEFPEKSDDGDLKDIKLKKIVGLLNKLDVEAKKKIINLLEIDE